LVSVTVPFEYGPVHELLPEYVPEICVLVTLFAVPLKVDEHPANGAENPPTGIVRVKDSVVPDSVPVTVPLPGKPLVVIFALPLICEPDCVSVVEMVPKPLESFALPDHEPDKLTVPLGPVGDLLPQADATRRRARAANWTSEKSERRARAVLARDADDRDMEDSFARKRAH
jgi:hypothetical protein